MIQKSVIAYIKLIFILGILLNFVGEMLHSNTVLAEDASKTTVIIRKYKEGDYSKLLEGATLSVESTDGGFKKEFQSDGIGEKLELPNGTYTLREVSPPPGYAVADPITFKVENGTVFIKKDEQFVENRDKETVSPYSAEAYTDRDEDSTFVSRDGSIKSYGKFYYAKSANGPEVVYCFNADLHEPPESYDHGDYIEQDRDGKQVKYTRLEANELIKYAQTPRPKDNATLVRNIKKVIEMGYKGQNRYKDLTALEFRAATQLAIYYFTDSAPIDSSKEYHGFELFQEKVFDAAREIVKFAEDDGESKISDLDFLVPNDNGYQSLIGTSYHEDGLVDVIRMEDKEGSVQPSTHQLTVSKTVSGLAGDKGKSFEFSITLKNAQGQPLTGDIPTDKGTIQLVNGVGSFTLTDGQTLTLKDLPDGYSYDITETNADGYTVLVDGQIKTDAKISATAVNDDVKVAFENRKDEVVPTGLRTTTWTYLSLLLVVVSGLGAWSYLFRKKV